MSKTKAGKNAATKAGAGSKPGTKATAGAGTKARASAASADKAPVKAVRVVEKEIVSKFPEMKGVRPSVVRRKVPAEHDLLELIEKINGELGARLSDAKAAATMQEIYLASFEKEMKTERGTVLRRIVRVTFDREGNILKLVSSK
jgi:hypothetical protein